jgi:hypothetical protein
VAALAVLAARVRRGDEVLKPSAEIGMIAALPTTCSSAVKLNALGERRSGILDGLNSVRSSAPDGGPVDSVCKRPAVP